MWRFRRIAVSRIDIILRTRIIRIVLQNEIFICPAAEAIQQCIIQLAEQVRLGFEACNY